MVVLSVKTGQGSPTLTGARWGGLLLGQAIA